jgi:hypothetical protein
MGFFAIGSLGRVDRQPEHCFRPRHRRFLPLIKQDQDHWENVRGEGFGFSATTERNLSRTVVATEVFMREIATALCLLVLAGAASAPAAAQQSNPPATPSCPATVQLLASRYNVTVELPAAPLTPQPGNPAPQSGSLGDKLATSQGVVQPPPTNDRAVIPAPRTNDPMPTAPPPQSGTAGAPAAPGGLSATDQTFLASILTAALAAANRGDDATCADQVQKANQFIAERAPK